MTQFSDARSVLPPVPDDVCDVLFTDAAHADEGGAEWLLARAQHAARGATLLTASERQAVRRFVRTMDGSRRISAVLDDAGHDVIDDRILTAEPYQLVLAVLWRGRDEGPEAYGVDVVRVTNDTVRFSRELDHERAEHAWPYYRRLRWD